MKNKITELSVKKEIIEYLNYRRFFVWNNRNTGLYNVKQEKWIPAPQRGISDILGMTPMGRFVAIEVKKPEFKKDGTLVNEPTKFQLDFLENVVEHGGIGIVVSSLDECTEKLDKLM